MRTLLVAACLGGAALAVTSSPVSASHAVVPAASSEAAHGRLGVTAHWTGLSPDQLHWPAVPKGNGPLFLGRGQNAGSAPVSPAPMVATAAPASPMTTFFNNLHQPGIAANGSTPPDSTGAVGPNNYVEMANSIIQVWGRDLTTNVASASFSTFANFTDPWCDPQVQWDQGANRWLAMFTLCNTTSQVEGFFLFWSKTSDPSDLVNGWCKIGFSTNPTLVDFPKLGHNSTYIDFGANVYDETTPSSNPPFLGALIAFFALPANGVTTCPTSGTIFTSPVLKNGDGTPAFTPVPVNTMTNSGLDYVVSSYDVSGGGSANKLAVWHLDSSGVITQDPDVTVPFPFSRPSPAPELGSTNLISTSDGRLTQAIGDPVNGIWTQHTVAGGAGSMVAWYELTQSGGGLVLTQSGNISSGTDFIFNGAVSPSYNSQGAAVEYSRSSSTIDPLIAAQVRVSSTPAGQMEPGELVIASSPAADVETVSCNKPTAGTPCRWGDYSALTYDPMQPAVVWGTNEINNAATAAVAWQDENFALWAAAPPRAPSVNAVTAGDGFACVTFTPSALSDGGVPDLSYTIRAYAGATLIHSVVITAPTTLGCIGGLTDGTAYTLTVTGANVTGTGAESSHSGPVTPLRGASASSSTTPPARTGVNQSPPHTPPPR